MYQEECEHEVCVTCQVFPWHPAYDRCMDRYGERERSGSLCQSAVAEAKRYAVLVRAVCLPATTSSRVTRLRALKDAVAQGLRRVG
jgi:hypothetical protein